MNKLYFQFPDAETARESLIAAGMLAVSEESGVPHAVPPYSVHVVGVLRPETPEGAPLADPLPGHHVNVLSPQECPADLAPFRVYPATPAHVWAGLA